MVFQLLPHQRQNEKLRGRDTALHRKRKFTQPSGVGRTSRQCSLHLVQSSTDVELRWRPSQPTGQSEQFGFRQLRVVSGGRLRQCRLRNTVTPRFHCAVYPLRAVTSAVAALVGHRHEFKILVDGSIVEGRRARLRCANWDRPTYFGYRSCIAVKRRRAFEGKEVRNGPPYFQIFVLKSRLLAFYPLSSGPLNNMRLVKSQSKIIYPGPKFVSWPLQLGCLRRHLHWKCRVFV